jgi:hypothetical protein
LGKPRLRIRRQSQNAFFWFSLPNGNALVVTDVTHTGIRSWLVVGVTLGVLLSILLGPALSKFLYGVGASDPASLRGSSLVLLTVAMAACYLPARSASHVDPLVALYET